MYEQEIEKLISLAPEFESLDEDTIEMVMDTASMFVSKKQFGKAYTLALIYYTAHLLTIQNITKEEGTTSGGVTREITSEHEGALSRSYGSALSSDSFLGKTIYGIMFERLKKGLIIPVMTRMG